MVELHAPVVTTLAAAVLGLMFTLLSAMVVGSRVKTKVNLGHGEEPGAASADPMETPLYIAVRSHANFAEYTPMVLLLIGLVELQTGPTLVVKLLAGGFVAARAMHPLGMRMKAPNLFRAGGFLLTLVILAAASVKALLLAL